MLLRLALMLTLATLAACGGGATTQPPAARVSTQSSAGPGCSDELSAAIDALAELDSRLDVGMTLDAYTERVGDAKVAVDRVVASEPCTTALARARQALDRYQEAARDWVDCVSNGFCTTDRIEPGLRQLWSAAGNMVELARRAMATE